MTGLSNNNRGFNGRILTATGIAVVLALLFFFVISPLAFSEKNETSPIPAAPDKPSTTASIAPQPKRYDFRLTGSETFFGVMALFAPGPEINEIVRQALPVYDLKLLKKDSVLRVYAADEKWKTVEYAFNDYDLLTVSKDSTGVIKAAKTELPHETRAVAASGSIENSLYEGGVKAGIDPHVLLDLSDIFAWDVDFASDIRKGDSFSVIYEELYVEGAPVKAGRVLAAEMVNGGKRFAAVWFYSAGTGAYYDEDGRSLRRTLLKSPLRFRRITSYFTNRRFHPIHKNYRPHHGIDYAAPMGTPVEGAGTGRVVYAGWKGGYGNFVEIKHTNGYSTAYGHLSRIKKGLRPGMKIEQGDVVGYVGSTGISTGPHLHYEVKLNGKLINPLGLKSAPNKSVDKAAMARFVSMRDELKRRLTDVSAAVATGGSMKTRLAGG
ncbi:MAG: M23 family metallopeptidase [Deltaproteobacteria bacterium]|nr:M23 family metallopeptidase [Deltaproteobacteria bacterium]